MDNNGRTYPQMWCNSRRRYEPQHVVNNGDKKISHSYPELDVIDGIMINDKDSTLETIFDMCKEKGDDVE